MDEKHSDSNQNLESFENDHVSVSVKKEPGCRVHMEIKVSPKASEAAYQKAIKMINKEVSLPGFRKGRAPAKMVEENYKKYIHQEWQDILVKTGFNEALHLTKIYPFSENSIQKPQLKDAAREIGGKISISFESLPNIPDIDPKSLKISKVEKKEVTEKEIENTLKNIQLHHATWEDVKERGVQPGDYVDVDIEDLDNPGRFICKDTRFEVEEGKMGKWMISLILGKNVGDTSEGTSERSDDLDPDVEFTPTQCKITVKGIKTPSFPEIDEDLAKKIGANSVEDLRQKVAKNLNTQAEEEVKNKLRKQIEQILCDQYSFEIPHSLLNQETQNRLNTVSHQMKSAGEPVDKISKRMEEIRSKIEKDAKESFQLFFITRHIADKNHISVSENELVRELMMQIYDQSSPIDTSKNIDEVRSKIYINLLSDKVKDFLIDQAAID